MSFYDELSTYYDTIFPLGMAQMNFIQKRLRENDKILDMAAGTGNYAIAIGNLGHKVTAIDLDEHMVKLIRDKSEENNLKVNALQLNMKEIDKLDEKYDFIICIGNSLVHLDSLEEIEEAIEKLYTMLNHKGILLIQTVNYDRILHYGIKELPTIDKGEVKFIRKYDINNNRVTFNGTIVVNKNGREDSYENSVQLFPLKSTDLIKILKSSGFKEIEIFGSFNEEVYSIDSFATVVAAYK